MKTYHLIIACLSLGLADGLSAAEVTNSAAGAVPARGDFVSFRVITERNIFNPRRYGRSSKAPPPRTEPEKVVKSERFALLGTMSYEKGRYAFFDGSSTDFRKVAKPEAT